LLGAGMKKACLIFTIILFASSLYAQTDTMKYQPVLNKFKMWYNNNQTDSLYSLCSDKIKSQKNLENWKNIISLQIKPVHNSLEYFVFSHSAKGIDFFKGLSSNPNTYIEVGFDQKFILNSIYLKELQKPRMQTPKPPFPYKSEDVEFDNADKSVHFGGTFTYPQKEGSFPTILLITGSGQQDRDETVAAGHKPFAVLADYLTRNGYAVLRLDDRGVGKTTGLTPDITTADFVKDISTGLDYLKTRKETDKNKLGLIGHSEGGGIAMMLAAERKDLDFIILWGAPFASGAVIHAEQNAISLRGSGFKEDAINAFKDLHLAELSMFKKLADSTGLHNNIKMIYEDWKKKQSSDMLKTLMVKNDSVLSQNIFTVYEKFYNGKWFRFFFGHDFNADIAKVKCKVLAVNGDKDTQVDAVSNLALAEETLKKNNNPNYKVVMLKGMNHLLQTAKTGDVSEYDNIAETISPEALKNMLDWLNEQVKNK
jgi:uncharacterized protein